MHHAFTGYQGHGKRVGIIVKNKLGNRTMTISMHYPWYRKKGFINKSVYPVNDSIDAFIRKRKSKEFTFGINVNKTFFGNFIDTSSFYITNEYIRLSSFYDGYIYLNSFSTVKGVTIQTDFVTKENYKYAVSQLPNPEFREKLFKYVGPKVLNQVAEVSYYIHKNYQRIRNWK